MLEGGVVWGRGGGGLGPKSLCTRNGPNTFVLQYMSFFPAVKKGGGGTHAKKVFQLRPPNELD